MIRTLSSLAASRDATDLLPTATIVNVDISAELNVRPARPPDYKREHDAFGLLTAELASHPQGMLQQLAEAAVDLCAAHTAGISLLDGDRFRWEAVAGEFAAARGATMPAHASPCGVCVERNRTTLMHLPDRCFPTLYADPRFVELMLIPFQERGQIVGTVWIASHADERRFDREDERIMRMLANYAAAGWQLWKACDRSEESNQRKDRLIATLGHELRNPLAAITAATAVLEQHYVGEDGWDARALEVITRQTQILERLAGDLLDSSRLASGKLRLARAPLDLWKVVTEAVDTFHIKIARRKLDVDVQMPQCPAIVDGDAVRLTQVFSNLIDNAAKFTPEGGRLAIVGTLECGTARVEIRDTGPGIPGDQIQRIFEPFAQLNDLHDIGPSTGLGLGLPLVRSLTELHGGTVTVASDGPGRGSCFTVCLPMRM